MLNKAQLIFSFSLFVIAATTVLLPTTDVFACMCDESLQTPEPLPEAYDKAAVIFIGKLEEAFWYGEPVTIRKRQPDGTILDITDVIPKDAKRRPYDPKLGMGLPFEVEFSVQKTFKDESHVIHNNKIVLMNQNYGWCGFPVAKDTVYIVYGRKEKDGEKLYASRCSRTNFHSKAEEDIKFLNDYFRGNK